MLFESERLVLRALEPEDFEWLYKVENDDTLWDCGTSNVPYSRYSLKRYIADSCHDLYADGQLRLVITNKETGAIYGCIDLQNFSQRHLRAEIGIFVFPEFQGKGIAKEAVSMICSYARDFLFLHQLYAIVACDNAKAIALFKSADFEIQSQLHDWLRSSRDEFEDAFLLSRLLF